MGIPPTPEALCYNDLADDLAAVLNSLSLRDVTLVCHSGASGEAIRYVSRHGTDRLARLILVGPTGPCMMAHGAEPAGLTPEMAERLSAQLATDLAGWIDENLEPFAPGHPARLGHWMATMVQNCSRRILLDFQKAIIEADLRAEVSKLNLPVTIIHGDQDVSAPIDLTARRYAALVHNAELLIYEDAAHGLMITHAARLTDDISARVMR